MERILHHGIRASPGKRSVGIVHPKRKPQVIIYTLKAGLGWLDFVCGWTILLFTETHYFTSTIRCHLKYLRCQCVFIAVECLPKYGRLCWFKAKVKAGTDRVHLSVPETLLTHCDKHINTHTHTGTPEQITITHHLARSVRFSINAERRRGKENEDCVRQVKDWFTNAYLSTHTVCWNRPMWVELERSFVILPGVQSWNVCLCFLLL